MRVAAAPLDGATLAHCYAGRYAAARERFLAAAERAGAACESHVHPERGRDGETLAMDVARLGPADAPRLLLISSGCHGVEGHAGSAIQIALLHDTALHAEAGRAQVALLLVHALNPYGFSWGRRTTHENVDLNRNFHDYAQPLPASPSYDAIAHRLVPAQWPPGWRNEAALAGFVLRHGARGLQQAVSGGQYRHADGLFYGGTAPTWSHRTWREVLRRHGRRCTRLASIDIHTGLGPRGHGERILACHATPANLARVRRWWGEVTSIEAGTSTSATLSGQLWEAPYDDCPQAELTGITLEIGTASRLEVLQALRAEQWLRNHPEQATPLQAAAIRQRLRDAFYIEAPDWQAAALQAGSEVAWQAVRGLGE